MNKQQQPPHANMVSIKAKDDSCAFMSRLLGQSMDNFASVGRELISVPNAPEEIMDHLVALSYYTRKLRDEIQRLDPKNG